MSNISDKRLKNILSYKNEHGIQEACDFFELSSSTIDRYQREAKDRGLDVGKSYDAPKILIADIETSPLEAFCFRTGKQYISTDHIKKGRSLLTFSAKWMCNDEVIAKKVSPEQAKNRDDKELVEEMWELFDEASAIVGHNFGSFDSTVANTRFLQHDLKPPSTYEIIDTYKSIRKQFDFLSHSLDYLTEILCDEEKQDTELELWKRCVNGNDESALQEMLDYNKQDVLATEDLWFKTRGYYKGGGINVGLYFNDPSDRCPRCGSKDLREGKGTYVTATGKYRTIRCESCGGIGRSRFCEISTEERKNIFRGTAH